ncbi:unnamed protein product [Trichogramma brassicae]|uniref:receptor protein-tyrosine kinase n=1 Tax=Trichogramma brassicae TaxID=86971 RepID=A0A6H5IJG0_9HYME|nr:unnamed protein product [Trichogramma brassicae]
MMNDGFSVLEDKFVEIWNDLPEPIHETFADMFNCEFQKCHESEKTPPPASPESRWEFPRDKLRLQTVLGEGNFGQVWKAEADDLTGHQGTTRLVAVKTVKEGASEREKEDLVRELEIMQKVGSHPNVVTLLGCCTEQDIKCTIIPRAAAASRGVDLCVRSVCSRSIHTYRMREKERTKLAAHTSFLHRGIISNVHARTYRCAHSSAIVRIHTHTHVITTARREPHYLILEYVMYGKLLTYLRDHRTRQDFYNFSEDSAALTSRDLTVFGYCVARGMEYLASKKMFVPITGYFSAARAALAATHTNALHISPTTTIALHACRGHMPVRRTALTTIKQSQIRNSHNPSGHGGAQRAGGPQQAVQDRRLRHVEIRRRERRGDRDAPRPAQRPAHQMDGTRVAHLFSVHDQDRCLELRHLDVGDRDARLDAVSRHDGQGGDAQRPERLQARAALALSQRAVPSDIALLAPGSRSQARVRLAEARASPAARGRHERPLRRSRELRLRSRYVGYVCYIARAEKCAHRETSTFDAQWTTLNSSKLKVNATRGASRDFFFVLSLIHSRVYRSTLRRAKWENRSSSRVLFASCARPYKEVSFTCAPYTTVLLVVVHRHAVDAIEIKHDYKFKNKISALLQRVDSSASGGGSSSSVISGNSYSSTTPSTTTTTTTTSRQDASLSNDSRTKISYQPLRVHTWKTMCATAISPFCQLFRLCSAGQRHLGQSSHISSRSNGSSTNQWKFHGGCRKTGRASRGAGAEVHEAGTKVPNTKTRDLAADEARHGKSTESLSSEAIMRSIRNNKDMVSALLTDFKIKDYNNNLLREDDEVFLPTARPGLLGSSSSSYKTSYDHHHQGRYHRDKPNLSLSPYDNRFESNEIKRKYEPYNEPLDNVEEGFTCPSQVKYAKPQLARAASGVWKYIINTDEHTQTLRLEKCSPSELSVQFDQYVRKVLRLTARWFDSVFYPPLHKVTKIEDYIQLCAIVGAPTATGHPERKVHRSGMGTSLDMGAWTRCGRSGLRSPHNPCYILDTGGRLHAAPELLVHLGELSLYLHASLQLSSSVDLGLEARPAHGHIQGADLLQLPRAGLHGHLSASSDRSAAQAARVLPRCGFRPERSSSVRQRKQQQHEIPRQQQHRQRGAEPVPRPLHQLGSGRAAAAALEQRPQAEHRQTAQNEATVFVVVFCILVLVVEDPEAVRQAAAAARPEHEGARLQGRPQALAQAQSALSARVRATGYIGLYRKRRQSYAQPIKTRRSRVCGYRAASTRSTRRPIAESITITIRSWTSSSPRRPCSSPRSRSAPAENDVENMNLVNCSIIALLLCAGHCSSSTSPPLSNRSSPISSIIKSYENAVLGEPSRTTPIVVTSTIGTTSQPPSPPPPPNSIDRHKHISIELKGSQSSDVPYTYEGSNSGGGGASYSRESSGSNEDGSGSSSSSYEPDSGPPDHVIPYTEHENPREPATRPNYTAPGAWARPAPDKNISLDFVPSKLYAQVRGTSTVQRLPREDAIKSAETSEEKENAARLREVVKITKANTVYSEEGYEDAAYDHAGQIRDADFHEGYAKKLEEEADRKTNGGKLGKKKKKKRLKKGRKRYRPRKGKSRRAKSYLDDYADHLEGSSSFESPRTTSPQQQITPEQLSTLKGALSSSVLDPKKQMLDGLNELERDLKQESLEAIKATTEPYYYKTTAKRFSPVPSYEPIEARSETVQDATTIPSTTTPKRNVFTIRTRKPTTQKVYVTKVKRPSSGRYSVGPPGSDRRTYATNPYSDQTPSTTPVNYGDLFWQYYKNNPNQTPAVTYQPKNGHGPYLYFVTSSTSTPYTQQSFSTQPAVGSTTHYVTAAPENVTRTTVPYPYNDRNPYASSEEYVPISPGPIVDVNRKKFAGEVNKPNGINLKYPRDEFEFNKAASKYPNDKENSFMKSPINNVQRFKSTKYQNTQLTDHGPQKQQQQPPSDNRWPPVVTPVKSERPIESVYDVIQSDERLTNGENNDAAGHH